MPDGRTAASFDEASEFESRVRELVALLYPGDPLGGATIAGGQERDGVFITDDMVVLVEATTSAEQKKAEKDGRKLKELADKYVRQYPYKAVKAFFVTRGDPTAHQRDTIKKIGSPVVPISFTALRARLIDGAGYLQARAEYAFGSARDPETDEYSVQGEYVPLDFLDARDKATQYAAPALISQFLAGKRVILLGDYGTGKSMTLREGFMRARRAFLTNKADRFCIHLNLSDHQGQTEPTEALLRHAQLVGFPHSHQLVRAWRSGLASIILDGFDETVALGTSASSRTTRDVRRASVELIRRFVKETPQDSGLLIAGRAHFFDSLQELSNALSLPGTQLIATASDFTEAQVTQYLANRKWKQELPDWLPRRPLLIGYLAGRRLLSLSDEIAFLDAGAGWDRLLSAICIRESRLEAGLDELAIRTILERIATLARKTTSGLGPLEFEDIVTVFRSTLGYFPEEQAYGVLQRLPGLRVSDEHSTARTIVDEDFADALRAGDLLRLTSNPYDEDLVAAFRDTSMTLGDVGTAVVLHRIETEQIPGSAVQIAAEKARVSVFGTMPAADLTRIGLEIGIAPSKNVVVDNLAISTVRVIGGVDTSSVTFSNCLIELVDLTEASSVDSIPYFLHSTIGQIEGIVGIDDLAASRLVDTEVGEYADSTDNSAAILRLNLPPNRRVALVLLRRIFAQAGHARRESALYRGNLSEAQRGLIPGVLGSLQKDGAIRKTKRRDVILWEPNRSFYSRVRQILDAPATSDDPILLSLE